MPAVMCGASALVGAEIPRLFGVGGWSRRAAMSSGFLSGGDQMPGAPNRTSNVRIAQQAGTAADGGSGPGERNSAAVARL